MRVVFVDYIHTSVEVGRANMVAVPRVDEYVSLDLSCPPVSGQLMFARFRVKKIEHDAKNTSQTLEWIRPYERSAEAGATIVHVDWADKQTEKYVNSVVEASKRDGDNTAR